MQELTQDDLESLYQPHKNLFVRLDLYENTPDANGVTIFRKVDEVQGVVIEGSIQEDAESEIRRTADLQMFVENSSFIISEIGKIWLDKYIIIYIGYPSARTKNMLWYNLGVFEMLEPRYSYDSTTQTLTLSLVDMVASLDGTKNGAVAGAAVGFDADSSSIREAIEGVISDLGNWHKYIVDDIGEYGYENVTTKNRIPYTIDMQLGATVYEIIVKLRDLYPGYESFFEKDGTFRVRRIPTCMNDPVVMTHEQLMPLVISENNNGFSFGDVRNVTEVFGKSFDASNLSDYSDSSSDQEEGVNYFTDMVYGINGNYEGKFEDLKITAIEDNMVFSFVPNHENPGGVTFKVNDFPAIPVIMKVPNVGDKEIPAGFIQEGMPIVLRYEPDETFRRRFVYLGRTQIRGVYMLVSKPRDWNEMQHDILRFSTQNIQYGVNPESPLTVDKIGERIQVFSGEEYENIESEVGALERAQYETWKTTNLAYTMELETILIPWLEVNQKISYESPLAEMERKELGLPIEHDYDTQYIIKRISRSLQNGTQTMELTRFYDIYPWIISSNKVQV